ncbi:threonine/homoserine/homoserine lactone efflux protein [Paraburkholderia sp. RAU6.4a]|uniref:LysE family translocator n=1 Tax=unclassified Paraburkholderia TaxID=2615204 RepID=UPI003D262241
MSARHGGFILHSANILLALAGVLLLSAGMMTGLGLAAASGWAATKKGYFVSMTNPKSIAFYGSIFALMVPAHAPLWLDIAVVALSIGISCAWYCAMALLASHPSVRRALVRRKAGLDTAAGVLLVGLGGRMLAGR